MKAKFAMKKFGRFFVLTLALACLLGLAGCGGETDKNKDDTDPTAQDVQVNDDAPAEPDAGEPEQDAEPETTPSRVTDLTQTEPEIHAALLKLDFEDGVVPESVYYRTVTDESGMACYEIQPDDSEQPVLIPMSNTVIYMAEQDAENADDTEEAYYERITLTYLLDDEPVESVQYQIFVPNALTNLATEVTDSPEAAE